MQSIQALREQRAEHVNALQAAIDDPAEFARIEAAIAKVDEQIADIEARNERTVKAAAAAARLKQSPADPAPVAATVWGQPAEKGLRAGAAMRILAAAGGNRVAAQVIAEQWGHSGIFAQQTAGTATAGGFLVPEDVSSEIIELLRPASVVMAMGPRVVPMPSGNITMNRVAVGTNAAYIGERGPIQATGMQLGQVKLSSKKLAALVPISNDLLKTASTAADQLVRDDLVLSMATRMDLAFIRGAGTAFSPLGMRNQLLGSAFEATNILAANATVNLANVTVDLGRLELALQNANITMTRPGYLMAPRTAMFLRNLRDGNGNKAFPEVDQGNLRGIPFRITTQIPINLGGGTESEIYLADFVHLLVGEEHGIELAVSNEAAYIDAAATMQASFSTDETVIRAIAKHDFGVRHLPAIAILTGVTWGA